jgi:hypothetical protein
VRSPAQAPRWHWHRWTVEGTVAACLAAFSSAREFSTLNRTDFSSDSAFCAAFKLLANTANKKAVSQTKRLKERNSEGVKGLPS